jgi:hypothetical protein
VTNLGTTQWCVGEVTANLVDVADNLSGAGTDPRLVDDAGGRDSVEILASNGNTIYEVDKIRAVLGDGVLEGSNFVVDANLATRAPKTKEKGGLAVDGLLDSPGRGVGCAVSLRRSAPEYTSSGATYDHGVETSRFEASGTDQVLLRLEAIGKVGSGAIVEALGERVNTGGGEDCRGDGGG